MSPALITPDSPTPRATGNVLDVALSRVGKDNYCWGGTAPPCFDCSGFVYWCFNQIGVPLNRAMLSQLNQGETIGLGPVGNRLMNAMPGDVVYFGLGNADPSRQHEGIITSTNGTGSMVQAECTACGPINIGPIGEGTGSEPISAIRRFTLTTGAGQVVPQSGQSQDAVLLSSSSDCKIHIPVIDLCLWHDGWSRAVLGAAFMFAALGLGITGLVLLTGAKLLQQRTPIPEMNFEKLNARLARTKPDEVGT